MQSVDRESQGRWEVVTQPREISGYKKPQLRDRLAKRRVGEREASALPLVKVEPQDRLVDLHPARARSLEGREQLGINLAQRG